MRARTAKGTGGCRIETLGLSDSPQLAYGWGDLDLEHGFHQTKQDTRFAISKASRQEALGRRLSLNHGRFAQEEVLGLHEKRRLPWQTSAPGDRFPPPGFAGAFACSTFPGVLMLHP